MTVYGSAANIPPVIPRIGGKYNFLEWLLPLIPYSAGYVEPFGGGAAVFINRAKFSVVSL